MAKNSIYDILNKPVANLPKNGFDLGEFFPYSLKLGQVKPISYIHTVPGGHYKLSVDELCHTEPFITDPFVRMTKHIEFVFVPFSQLWHGSEQFFGHANDPVSSYEQGHNFVPNFNLGNMLERIWNSVSVVHPTVDMQHFHIQETALSLLDMLGYGAHPLYLMTDEERASYITKLKGKYVNAWNLLAYNKYWNCYLRDTQHTSPLSPSIFNADKVPCTTEATSHMDSYYTDAEMLELVTIKYRKVKRDLFTSSLTSRQFGAVEGVSLSFSGLGVSGNGGKIGELSNNGYVIGDGDSFYLSGSDSGNTLIDAELRRMGTEYYLRDTEGNDLDIPENMPLGKIQENKVNSVNGSISALSVNGSASFDVYTLLTAQLTQKWKEQIQRAGNKTDDRLRAQFGMSFGSSAKNQPNVFGATSYPISANQVTSTGEGTNTKLGDIAAKGIGYAQRNEFTFNATEFGVILVCTYILPENAYLAPVDKLNTQIEPFDYWVPQLENLGLEPVLEFFRAPLLYNPSSGKYTAKAVSTWNSINGYAARNWQYKQKVNKVHLGFEHGIENSKWMPSRSEVDPTSGLSVNPYYVAPNEYDTVFGTTTDYHLDTDQFIGCARVSCDSVLPMSELGLPRW